MPNEPPAPITDPYSGQHAESIYAIWHDPSTYDHMRMGPPYLPTPPGGETTPVRLGRSEKQAIRAYVTKVANESPATQIFLHLVGEYQGIALAELGVLVSILRAAALVHQTHHWQTEGVPFYGDHLLYERIYNESLEHIDRLAERAVGTSNSLLVHPVLQATQMASLVKFFCGDIPVEPSPDGYALLSFMTEVYTLSFLGMANETLQSRGVLTPGTGNLIQDACDRHESFVYLLRQRVQTRVSYDRTRSTTPR